jgi:hypothetical protein
MVSPEGNLQNVFNNSDVRGQGGAHVRQAVERHGAKTLDAYDGYLPGRFGGPWCLRRGPGTAVHVPPSR